MQVLSLGIRLKADALSYANVTAESVQARSGRSSHANHVRDRGLDHRRGDSLDVEGAGAFGFRKSLVTILSPFSSRYIATTIVPAWSALGRIVDPSGVSSLEPSVRVILVPVSSTRCT